MSAPRADGDTPTTTYPWRVVVVGSGPSGVYTCESVLRAADEASRDVAVELVEKLPVPFGLLRYGVAPDHPRIKSVARVLREVLDDSRLHFVGNVEVGTDVSVDELLERAHAVVVCTGALADRSMGVPGEDLAGSYGAAEFVTWYDGHPDAPHEFPLDAEKVAVVGVGNVALDVARMLVRSAADLEPTDIPAHVHTAFSAGRCREVTVLGRRGPEHAKFTPLELRELDDVDGVTVVVDPADLVLDDEAQAVVDGDRHVAKILARLQDWADAQTAAGFPDADDAAAAALADGRRVIRFRFRRSPVEILGDGEKVIGLRVEETETSGGRVVGTGRTEDLDVNAVFRAVGYRSASLPDLPFDDTRAVVPNDAGRVLAVDGATLPGVYTAGWVKRGPTGVIGTNRHDAAETVDALVADLDQGLLSEPVDGTVRDLLESRGVAVVDNVGWRRIDAEEAALGAAAGRERTKIADRAEMLRLARPSS